MTNACWGYSSRLGWRAAAFTATANSHWICATWASNAASTVLPDCCAAKVYAHKQATCAAQVHAAANLLWLPPIT